MFTVKLPGSWTRGVALRSGLGIQGNSVCSSCNCSHKRSSAPYDLVIEHIATSRRRLLGSLYPIFETLQKGSRRARGARTSSSQGDPLDLLHFLSPPPALKFRNLFLLFLQHLLQHLLHLLARGNVLPQDSRAISSSSSSSLLLPPPPSSSSGKALQRVRRSQWV